MTDLKEVFDRLGLSQYLEGFRSEGFDTWDTVLDITESDLITLNVKLGHRRKLQRAIADARGEPTDRALAINNSKTGPPSVEGGDLSYDSSSEAQRIFKRAEPNPASAAGPTTTKRKYRRHPKADENAPERPPSAYVIFSNQMREYLKERDLSFTEIAKIVGERWSVLSAEEKEPCERQASTLKERYYTELAEYKKTEEYSRYQEYLKEFKAKHGLPQQGKRSKVESEPSYPAKAPDYDHARGLSRRMSSGLSLGTTPDSLPRAGSTPPVSSASHFAAQKPLSPSTNTFSAINSPIGRGDYSPMSASPVQTTSLREGLHELPPNHRGSIAGIELSGRRPETAFHHPQSGYQSYGSPYVTTPTNTSPASGGQSYYTTHELPSRRGPRNSMALPSLVHDETTLSSESTGTHGSGSISYQGPLLNLLESNKMLSQRVLPAPVPSLNATSSPLDQRATTSIPPGPGFSQQPSDYRSSSSLAALLRASEIAQDSENQGQDDSTR